MEGKERVKYRSLFNHIKYFENLWYRLYKSIYSLDKERIMRYLVINPNEINIYNIV